MAFFIIVISKYCISEYRSEINTADSSIFTFKVVIHIALALSYSRCCLEVGK